VPLLELGATAPLRSAAAGGAAPAVLSDLAVREDLAAGRLVEIPVDGGLDLERTLRAVWPRDADLPEAAGHLLWIAQTDGVRSTPDRPLHAPPSPPPSPPRPNSSF
jgi:DNA-binding transcriptional LysR family regulator